MKPIRVLVWDENKESVPQNIYPGNIRTAIAVGLNKRGAGNIVAVPVSIDDENQGISKESLANTDVLI